jgi:hypothetical protein
MEIRYLLNKLKLIESEQLLAPNGKPSNLNPVQYQQVRTPEFKSWFGDSKVVDENGEPLIVYHATNADFTEFDTNLGSGVAGKGTYVTSIKPSNDNYGNYVMPLFVSIRNPIDFSSGDKAINDKAEDLGLEGLFELSSLAQIDKWSGELKQKLQQEGHDGAELKGDGNARYFVAYNSNQIKSAIGNTGSFSQQSNKVHEGL